MVVVASNQTAPMVVAVNGSVDSDPLVHPFWNPMGNRFASSATDIDHHMVASLLLEMVDAYGPFVPLAAACNQDVAHICILAVLHLLLLHSLVQWDGLHL